MKSFVCIAFFLVITIVSVITVNALSNKSYLTPPPTFNAKDYTTWQKRSVQKSRRADVTVNFPSPVDGSDDYIHLFRLDLVGNSYERGYAHGYLLAKEITEFLGPKMDKYYMDAFLDIDIGQYPEPIQDILRIIKIKGAVAAPAAVKKAMAWVWEKEIDFTPQYIKDEINGMAVGMCDAMGGSAHCDVEDWKTQLQEFNMMPELIRMACTAYGAWGKATPSGKGLVQVRALDFGGGPYANYTIVSTHRGTENDNAFVSVAFPGMAGAITGVSQRGIGISEKVWMIYTDERNNLQPGSFEGEADVFILRDILQNAKNRVDAENYIKAAKRTWGMWVGVGDYETMKFDIVAYRQSDAAVYDDVTAPTMTGQPYIENIAYVDKHPQPSGEGPTGTLPQVLQDFWGNITLETSKTVTQYHKTGDVHIASYDFEHKEMYLAIGRVDHNGKYGPDDEMWNACNRPYVKFDLNDLWEGK